LDLGNGNAIRADFMPNEIESRFGEPSPRYKVLGRVFIPSAKIGPGLAIRAKLEALGGGLSAAAR
jgi:hypothetical protein